ncbi:glycosyltransferase [Microbacterium timonense]|uniref:glycosyltransferase n=1 Tax=Microbacterium timonense TaxID=2086576 RepID=UPI000D0F0255|nr:glycosyltransferase [Microbacterium timonense]
MTERAGAESADAAARPRLAFFRLNDNDLPEFIRGHFDDHVRCLDQFFDVTVITENCDYDEVVDRVRPDVALFESGVYARPDRSITRTDTHPQIPKIGLLDADAYCLTRSVFLSDMDDWGVETFFTIAASATGYTPDIGDRTYVWPNFADRSVFHSYPEGKTQTILLSGSRATNYPWRVRVDRVLAERFPVRALPHAGWFGRDAAAGMPSGEAYARSLSSALIVPTCGTIADELVRKHFEIPAAGAILLTERTDAVEAAGFVDMENCIFADTDDVVDKVEQVLGDEALRERIARSGQELAHSRHSIENRSQIREWYDLSRQAKSGERVFQRDLFGPLVLERADSQAAVSPVAPAGVDRILVASGQELLRSGRPELALDQFAQVLNMHFEPAAAYGVARSWLMRGDPARARRILEYSTGVVVRAHGASQPDPVEWAALLRAVLCEGKPGEALELAERHPGIRHPELDRTRWVVSRLAGVPVSFADRPVRRSVHGRSEPAWEDWRAEFGRELEAAGQPELATRVAGLAEPGAADLAPGGAGQSRPRLSVVARRGVRLGRRVAGRIGREWSRVRGTTEQPDRTAMSTLLGGMPVDVVVALLVDDAVASRAESAVVNDGTDAAFVRVGRATLPDASATEVPHGLRHGANERVLAGVLGSGRAVVVTSAVGAAYLEPSHLDDSLVLVLVGETDETRIEQRIGEGGRWHRAPRELEERLGRLWDGETVRVWVNDADDHAGGS